MHVLSRLLSAILLSLCVAVPSLAGEQPQSPGGNPADSLQTDLEFMAYLSGLLHMQDGNMELTIIRGNGWKPVRVVLSEGVDLSFVYNSRRRITVMRMDEDTTCVYRILLYDLAEESLPAIKHNLEMLGYKYVSTKAERPNSRVTAKPYTHETFTFCDDQHFSAIVFRDTYDKPPRETCSVYFSVPL